MAALATPLGRSTAANWKEALAESTTIVMEVSTRGMMFGFVSAPP